MIKILTFYYPKNYGAFLQCFALQYATQGYVVDFVPNWKFFIGKKTERIPILKYFLGQWRRFKEQAKFPELKKLTLKKIEKNEDFNIFIAGSDQVWNPRCIQNLSNIYFLDFLSPKAKRISYAASLGMDHWPKDFEDKVIPMLQKFSAISVREESSVSYLTSLGLKNIECVCDPTILHSKTFYQKEFGLKQASPKKIFIYRIREKITSTMEDFSDLLKERGYEKTTVDLQKSSTLCSVTDWLNNIYNASCVITDSFHCAVFCILFHRPFLVIGNQSTSKGMNERFQTLLGKTGLLYRFLPENPSMNILQDIFNRPIDWHSIDEIVEEWRNHSIKWLKESLKS